ncbi:MAG TPA: TolC family protein [Bacteroidales bacterium]|nr:TolC family protein [Bacteroidales bacterium]
MKRKPFILILIPFALSGQSTDTVSLWDCFHSAVTNYPLYRQKDLNADMLKYHQSNILKSWYPDISLDGQATYQSDVVGFGSFAAPHDQYKLTLDISQQLYDGGFSKNRKEIENSNLNIKQQQIELDFHNVKQQVSSVFFLINLIRKNIELVTLTHEELNERLKTLLVAIKNGVILPENEYVLRAEILKIEQQNDELHYKLAAAMDVLGKITGLVIKPDAAFDIPVNVEIHDSIAERPEIQLFEFQKMLIDNNISLSKCTTRPKLFIFTQAGYGKPGLNMLDDEFDTYYIVGAGMKWNLIDWGENRNTQKIGNLQKDAIDMNKNHFNRNILVALRNELATVEYYQSSVIKDEKMIELKHKIKESAYSQFINGIITATEYLVEVNAELHARLQLESHRIFMVQSIVNYQLIKGDI